MTWAQRIANNTVTSLPPSKADSDDLRSIGVVTTKEVRGP
jgi:hypothetical protein